MRRHSWRTAGLLFVLLAASACFDDPVEQSLDLSLLPGHHAVLTVRVTIRDGGQTSPALAKRLESTRRELLDGMDEWSPRFAALTPGAERFGWEKQLGELRSVTRAALIDQSEDLERFFADTATSVVWREADGSGELALFPSSPARASANESAQMRDALAAWSASIATYLERTRALYAYLDSRPGRAEICLGRLLREDLPDGKFLSLPAASNQEERLIEAVRDAMNSAADVLLVSDTAAESLEELSHRVYDPFPAAITVRTPGPILELEGFAASPPVGRAAGATLRVRRLGLWEALRSQRGKWLAPDPLLLHVAHQQQPDGRFDLGAVVAQGRRATALSALEVETALAGQLVPQPSYRVVWSTAGLRADDDKAMEQALRHAWPPER